MLIMHQNKQIVVNTKKVSIFFREGTKICCKLPDERDYILTVAMYDTEERAQEILTEMMLRICNWENLKAGQPTGICNPVYEMPQE